MLTADQAKAANELFTRRPPVLPGTRAIYNTELREAFYATVTRTMVELKITNQTDVNEFCNLAGIPD